MDFIDIIRKEIDNFVQNPPDELIIWGAGETGKQCVGWLRLMGLDRKIKGIVDTRKNKIGTTILDLTVYSPDWLSQEKHIAVIIASAWHYKFFDKISNNLDRPIFYFRSDCIPYYKGGTYDVPISELYDIYRPDRLTSDNIDLSMMFRRWNFDRHRRHGGELNGFMYCSGIIPYSMTKYISNFCDYWGDHELSLRPFEVVTIVDGGAYTGDTIEYLINAYGQKIAKIYAFEPDIRSFSQLTKTIEMFNSSIAQCFCNGLSDKHEKARFDGGNDEMSTFMVSGNTDIEVDTVLLDDVIKEVHGKLCIKLDIEGYELNALKGASKIIQRYKPELSICVYHKYNDIIEIPKFIKSLVPEYNCILRGEAHLECYASVDRF